MGSREKPNPFFKWCSRMKEALQGSSTSIKSPSGSKESHPSKEDGEINKQGSGKSWSGSDVSTKSTDSTFALAPGRTRNKISVRQLRIAHKCVDESAKSGAAKNKPRTFNFKRTFREDYKVVKMLGRGAFGVVFLAVHQSDAAPSTAEVEQQLRSVDSTGAQGLYAVKRIKKDLLRSVRQSRALLLEIEVMIKLRSNINVVNLNDVYEDDQSVYMVMEFCSGGDLIQISKGHTFKESTARLYFEAILRLVKNCHEKKILHRDIKPDNFLKSNKSPKAPLKMIDFGLAASWTGALKTDMTGTPFYMAPEVINKQGYGPPADLWSAGCLLFFMIAGHNPWEPCNSFKELKRRVTHDGVRFAGDVWKQVSPEVRDLIKALLTVDPDKRLTAEAALAHPWIDPPGGSTRQATLNDSVIQKFQKAGSFNRLKKKVLCDALNYLEMEETEELIVLFNSIDADGSGRLSWQEMITGLQKHGYKVSDVEVKVLMDNIDVDGNGELDQHEFIVGLLDLRTFQKERKWQQIVDNLFAEMDTDKDGHISADELKSAIPYSECLEDIEEEISEIMEAVDADADGFIDIQEFKDMINDAAASLDSYDKRLIRRYYSKTHEQA